MGWRVKQYKDGKYALYSTIVDRFITGKSSRNTIIQFIIKDWEAKLREKIRELKSDFPNGWMDKDTWKLITKGDK